MNAETVIQVMGGRAQVIAITGLTKGRIAQWVKDDYIPRPWLIAFASMNPAVPSPLAVDSCMAGGSEKPSETSHSDRPLESGR